MSRRRRASASSATPRSIPRSIVSTGGGPRADTAFGLGCGTCVRWLGAFPKRMRGSRADAEPLLLPPPRLRPLSAGGGRGACAFAGRGDRRSRGGDARHGSALKSASRGVLGGAGAFVKGEMKRGSFQSPCWFGLPSTICAGAVAFGSDIDIISLAAAWTDPTTLPARSLLALLEECNREMPAAIARLTVSRPGRAAPSQRRSAPPGRAAQAPAAGARTGAGSARAR